MLCWKRQLRENNNKHLYSVSGNLLLWQHCGSLQWRHFSVIIKFDGVSCDSCMKSSWNNESSHDCSSELALLTQTGTNKQSEIDQVQWWGQTSCEKEKKKVHTKHFSRLFAEWLENILFESKKHKSWAFYSIFIVSFKRECKQTRKKQ